MKIILMHRVHGANHFVVLCESDSSFPVKPYRQYIKFYD